MSQKHVPLIAKQYEELCAQLGDLTIKKKQVLDQIAAVETKIQALNEIYPSIQQLELQLVQELSKDKE